MAELVHAEEEGLMMMMMMMSLSSSMGVAEEHVYPIFRVPAPLRSIVPTMFSPQLVAIGPLHSPAWNPNLSPPLHSVYTEMELYKMLCWYKIFKQDMPQCEGPFLYFLHQHKDMMLASYGGRLEKEYGTHTLEQHFLRQLALDACFIAAVLHCLFQEDFPHLKAAKMDMEDSIMVRTVCTTAHFYPVYSQKLPRPVQKAILEDLLLVENQIPLLAVIQAIKMESKCRSDEEAERVLQLYIAALAHRLLPFNRSKSKVLSSVKNVSMGVHHLMDMMYCIVCMRQDASDSMPYIETSENPHVKDVPGANDLYLSGVKLHGHEGSLNELSFSKGRLSIPKIHVGDDTERFFRNLIAYESCFKTDRLDIISYLHFMDFLIDTPADVDLLMENKIITEAIGSNAKVAEMWNGLCRNNMCMFSPKYRAVANQVQSYCKSPRRKMWAEFYRSKLAKPWLVASLICATALLLMNFLILWYTVLLYRHEKQE